MGFCTSLVQNMVRCSGSCARAFCCRRLHCCAIKHQHSEQPAPTACSSKHQHGPPPSLVPDGCTTICDVAWSDVRIEVVRAPQSRLFTHPLIPKKHALSLRSQRSCCSRSWRTEAGPGCIPQLQQLRGLAFTVRIRPHCHVGKHWLDAGVVSRSQRRQAICGIRSTPGVPQPKGAAQLIPATRLSLHLFNANNHLTATSQATHGRGHNLPTLCQQRNCLMPDTE